MPELKNRQTIPIKLITALVVIGLVVVVGLVMALNQTQIGPSETFVQPTLDPTVRASLTALPDAPALSEADIRMFAALRADTEACADYSEPRRVQMLQHITWLEHPQQIPPDVAFALTLGGAINSRLIYGMAIFTSTEWRLLQRPAGSCLIDIGLTLNDMLAAVGEAPLTIYDE